MKRPWRILVAVASLAALAGGAAAEPERSPGRRFGPPGPPPIDRILARHAEELGLSEVVQAKVRTLAADAEAESKPLRAALDAQREAMHALLIQDAPDPDAVLHQADLVGAAETALHKQRLRTLLAVRALLTPEQRRELVRIFEEKRRHMEERGFRRGPPPDAPDAPDAP